MPRVPYDLPSVELQPGPSGGGGFSAPRVVPQQDATGEHLQQLGQSAQRAGQVTTDIVARLQEQVDDARTKEAYSLFSNTVRTSLYDPKDGYLHTVGKAATGYSRARAVGTLDKKRMEIEKLLDNDVQRRMFRQVADRHMQNVLTTIDEHEAKQVRVYHLGESKAFLEAAKADAVNAYTIGPSALPQDSGQEPKPDPFKLQWNTAVQQTNEIADQLGIEKDSPQRRAMVLGTTTSIHAGVIERLVDEGRTDRAREYLKGVKADEVEPVKMGDLQKLVRNASVQDEGLRLAAKVLRSQPPTIKDEDETGELRERRRTPLDIHEAARRQLAAMHAAGTSTEVIDNARSRIDREVNALEVREADYQRELMQRAEAYLRQNPMATPETLPPKLRTELQDTRRLGTVEDFARNGNQYGNDPVVFLDTLRAAEAGALEGVPWSVVFSQLRGRLDDRHLAVIQALHAKSNGGGRTAPDDDWIVSSTERVKRAAADARIIPHDRPARGEQARDFERFEAEIQSRVSARMSAGEPKSAKLLQDVIDEVLLDRLTLGNTGLFSFLSGLPEPTTVATMTEEEQQRAFVDVSPTMEPLAVRPGAEPVAESIAKELESRIPLGGKERVTPAAIPRLVTLWLVELMEKEGIIPSGRARAALWVRFDKPMQPPAAWLAERQRRAAAR